MFPAAYNGTGSSTTSSTAAAAVSAVAQADDGASSEAGMEAVGRRLASTDADVLAQSSQERSEAFEPLKRFRGRALLAAAPEAHGSGFANVHLVHGQLSHVVLSMLHEHGLTEYNATFARKLQVAAAVGGILEGFFSGAGTAGVGLLGQLSAASVAGPIGLAVIAAVCVAGIVYNLCGACETWMNSVASDISATAKRFWNSIVCLFKTCRPPPPAPEIVRASKTFYQDALIPGLPSLVNDVMRVQTVSIERTCFYADGVETGCTGWRPSVGRRVVLSTSNGDAIIAAAGALEARSNTAGEATFLVANRAVLGTRGPAVELVSALLATFSEGREPRPSDFYWQQLWGQITQQGSTLFWLQPSINVVPRTTTETCEPEALDVSIDLLASSLFPGGLKAAVDRALTLLADRLVDVFINGLQAATLSISRNATVPSLPLTPSQVNAATAGGQGMRIDAFITTPSLISILQPAAFAGTRMGAVVNRWAYPPLLYTVPDSSTRMEDIARVFDSFPVCILFSNPTLESPYQIKPGLELWNGGCIAPSVVGEIRTPPQLLWANVTSVYGIINRPALDGLVANTVPLHMGLYTLYQTLLDLAAAGVPPSMQRITNFLALMYAVAADTRAADAILTASLFGGSASDLVDWKGLASQQRLYSRMLTKGASMRYGIPGVTGALPDEVRACYAAGVSTRNDVQCMGRLGSQWLASTALVCKGTVVTAECLGLGPENETLTSSFAASASGTAERRLLAGGGAARQLQQSGEGQVPYNPQQTYEPVRVVDYESTAASDEPFTNTGYRWVAFARDQRDRREPPRPPALTCTGRARLQRQLEQQKDYEQKLKEQDPNFNKQPQKVRPGPRSQSKKRPWGTLLALFVLGLVAIFGIVSLACGTVAWSHCGDNQRRDELNSTLALYFPTTNDTVFNISDYGSQRYTLLQNSADLPRGATYTTMTATSINTSVNGAGASAPWSDVAASNALWNASYTLPTQICLNPGANYSLAFYNALQWLASFDQPVCFSAPRAQQLVAQNSLDLGLGANVSQAGAATVAITGRFWWDLGASWPPQPAGNLSSICNVFPASRRLHCGETCRIVNNPGDYVAATAGDNTTVQIAPVFAFGMSAEAGPLRLTIFDDAISALPSGCPCVPACTGGQRCQEATGKCYVPL